MTIIGENNSLPAGSVIATIGSFDGVHRGHHFVFSHLTRQARRRGLQSAVVTFHEHPQHVLRPTDNPLPLLTTTDEKLALLRDTGIDHVILLHFTPSLAALSAAEFMQLLHSRYGVAALLTGYNHHFGHGSDDSRENYAAIGRQVGVDVIQAPEFQDESSLKISSSNIRRLLLQGNVTQAASLLGRHYALTGTVEPGQHLGATLGFPTANVAVADAAKLIPAHGAYAAIATTDTGTEYAAMVNIGVRPTVDDRGERVSIEAHLIHCSGDIYGRQLTVRFVERLRDEVKFSSVERLTEQLGFDRRHTELIIQKLKAST